jgi:glutathione S-transferase
MPTRLGMVSFEKGSKVVMSLGSADPAFVKRGEQNFARFASVLDACLAGKTWLLGDRLTTADFAVGGVIPNAQAMDLSFAEYLEISRWYAGLCALPCWHTKLST